MTALLPVTTASWFFFAHRTDLTMSVFAYWGDHYYEVGRYNRAITCYRQAVKLAPDNVSLPIRLAETYILSGNYSKAEYTLVSAITQNPDSVALYAALSKTYVEQDKLLDAEQMLGRITSADVKAQIDALRPATPVFSPETGYYTEYIDVTVTSGGSPVYVTLNEDYPSIATDTYTGPITLGGGESKLVAIAVGSNGLVSDAAYGGYTVGNVVEPVTLEDSALDTLVRELLGKTAADTIMTDELWEISELVLPDNMTTLNDLTRFAGLKQLSLHSANDLDLTQLASISTLESLDLSGCTISSSALAAICTLPELQSLNLSGCALAGILTTTEANVFDLAKSYADEGRRYGLIICDPPAFAKSRKAVDGAYRGYKELNLRCMKMAEPGGILVTCSCSQFMTPELFFKMLREAAFDAGRDVRLLETLMQSRDHPASLLADQALYLKGYILQIF